MTYKTAIGVLVAAMALACTGLGAWLIFRPAPDQVADHSGVDPSTRAESTGRADLDPAPVDPLERRFTAEVRPFVDRYCVSCHGPKKHKGGLDLSQYATVSAAAAHLRRWGQVLDRLQSEEMPPEEAPRRPRPEERAAAIAWIRDLQRRRPSGMRATRAPSWPAASATRSTITPFAI